jgi:ABC-type transporter Mla subunit MlaD
MADSNTLITVLIVFVALCALSQLGQFLAVMGLYRKVKEIHAQAGPLFSKAEATLDSARITFEDSRKQLRDLSVKTNDILDATKVQLVKIDGVVTEASDRARVQMERVEFVLGDTADRVQNVVATLQDGVLRPVKEVNALVAGLRGGFGALFKRERPNVAHATQDEEMFI